MGLVTIRPGRAADAAALAGVQRAAALAALGSIFPPHAPKPTLASLEEGWAEVLADPAARVLVAEAGDMAGEPVGGAAVRPSGGRWLLATVSRGPGR